MRQDGQAHRVNLRHAEAQTEQALVRNVAAGTEPVVCSSASIQVHFEEVQTELETAVAQRESGTQTSAESCESCTQTELESEPSAVGSSLRGSLRGSRDAETQVDFFTPTPPAQSARGPRRRVQHAEVEQVDSPERDESSESTASKEKPLKPSESPEKPLKLPEVKKPSLSVPTQEDLNVEELLGPDSSRSQGSRPCRRTISRPRLTSPRTSRA